MHTYIRTGVLLFAVVIRASFLTIHVDDAFVPRAHAQAVPKSLQEGGSELALRNRKNAWTVGVAGGILSGTYMTFAAELAEVLDDGDNLRVLPIATYGAAS